MIYVVAILILVMFYVPIWVIGRYFDRRGFPYRKSIPYILAYVAAVAATTFWLVGNARGIVLVGATLVVVAFAFLYFWLGGAFLDARASRRDGTNDPAQLK